MTRTHLPDPSVMPFARAGTTTSVNDPTRAGGRAPGRRRRCVIYGSLRDPKMTHTPGTHPPSVMLFAHAGTTTSAKDPTALARPPDHPPLQIQPLVLPGQ